MAYILFWKYTCRARRRRFSSSDCCIIGEAGMRSDDDCLDPFRSCPASYPALGLFN